MLPLFVGLRNCIGQKFALLEIKTLVQFILLNFKLTAVTKREDIQFTIDLVLRPIHPILVKFERRCENYLWTSVKEGEHKS